MTKDQAFQVIEEAPDILRDVTPHIGCSLFTNEDGIFSIQFDFGHWHGQTDEFKTAKKYVKALHKMRELIWE